MLLDSGEDTCLCDQDVLVVEETDRKVDVIGYNDNTRTKDVTIGSAMMLPTTSDSMEVLIHVNEGLLFEHGKSLFSTTQIRHFKHHVDETLRCFGGKGCIDTLEGHRLLFHLDHGMLTAKIRCPTDDEMKHLDVIELTSDIPWDPSELDEDEVFTKDEIVIAKANPTGTEPVPRDLEEMRPYLGWKSTDIIEKTLKAMTQHAKNHLRLPMRQHFKTRFPALLCCHLRKTFATDTFFSSESAHDGTRMAQVFVGKTSLLTEIISMQQEWQFSEALKAFILKCEFLEILCIAFEKNVSSL